MGYTHYWRFDLGNLKPTAYKRALRDMRKIIRESPILLGDAFGKGNPKLVNGVFFNGVGSDGLESFYMYKGQMNPRALLKAASYNWCKTGYRPYDMIVIACLCVLKAHLGDCVHVSSDGYPHEWEGGREFAVQVLKRPINIPRAILQLSGFMPEYAERYLAEHPEYAPDAR